LRVYFSDEIAAKPGPESLNQLIESHSLSKNRVLILGVNAQGEEMANAAGVNYLKVDKLFQD
jgi:phosphoglycolate phosphatase-like HAD superfamily hydrolase